MRDAKGGQHCPPQLNEPHGWPGPPAYHVVSALVNYHNRSTLERLPLNLVTNACDVCSLKKISCFRETMPADPTFPTSFMFMSRDQFA